MNITLISPYPDLRAIGVRLLSASLKKKGHAVRILFCPNSFWNSYTQDSIDEIVRFVDSPDLVGISLMTNFFDNAVQLTEAIKKHSSAPVIWGGIHPTIRPEECLQYADMVCLGEGEVSIVELADKMASGRDIHNTNGIWFKVNGNIIKNEIQPLVQDLNSIPIQDYSSDTHYILKGMSIQKVSQAHLQEFNGGKYMTLPTRGCPFACTYCGNNFIKTMFPGQSQVRKRGVDNIMRELTQAKEIITELKSIYFDDDSFFLYSLDEIREFSTQYKKQIGLPLIITGGTPTTITREKLGLLVDAGLTSVRMGIQSASEQTNKMYNRNYSINQINETAKIIDEFRHKVEFVQYDVIIDNPWETDQDLIETLRALVRLRAPYFLCIFSMTFYPGTELYDKAKREGLIVDEVRDVYRKYYHGCRKTYLNSLFFLLNAFKGKMSPITMDLLTNRMLMKLKISRLLYFCLKIKYFAKEGFGDILKSDWSRIFRRLKPIFGR